MDRLILTGGDADRRHGREPVARTVPVVIERGPDRGGLRGRREGDAQSSPSTAFTLLPGAHNCHVHFCLGGEARSARVLFRGPGRDPDDQGGLRTKQTIEAGRHTLRDLGGVAGIALAMRTAVSAGLSPVPASSPRPPGIC